MATISIRNVGPITDTGLLQLGQVNVFMGKQSTGKSTVMKILCYCQWIEKKIVAGGERDALNNYSLYNRFKKELMQFHRFDEEFFSSKSEIHYQGEYVDINFPKTQRNNNAKIIVREGVEVRKHNTKLCFIPSERNLVSAIKNIDRAYKSNDYDVLFNHISEWEEIKRDYTEEHPMNLSVIGNMEYYYDRKDDRDVIKLSNGQRKIDPFFASSGVQSVLPLSTMIDYLTDSVFEKKVPLSSFSFQKLIGEMLSRGEQFNLKDVIEAFGREYGYKSSHLFIEEPEQNLFPESQQALMEFVAGAVNRATKKTEFKSSVSMTTHSPYIITALNVLIKAHEAEKKSPEKTHEIIAPSAILSIDDVSAYYIRDDGTLVDIVDRELGMISGVELDNASDIVEKRLSQLDDIIYGE